MTNAIESPCVEVCQIRKGEKLCHGCFRTLDEIAKWGAMTAAERRRIMNELPVRKSAAAATP